MLDYGFDNFQRVSLFEAGEFTYSLPLSGADTDTVTLTNKYPVSMTVPSGRVSYKVNVYGTSHFLTAPVSEGATFGEAVFSGELCRVGCELTVSESIESKTKPRIGFFERILKFFTVD